MGKAKRGVQENLAILGDNHRRAVLDVLRDIGADGVHQPFHLHPPLRRRAVTILGQPDAQYKFH